MIIHIIDIMLYKTITYGVNLVCNYVHKLCRNARKYIVYICTETLRSPEYNKQLTGIWHVRVQ